MLYDWLRFVAVWVALLSAGLSLGTSLISLNAIQEQAMMYLNSGPPNSTECEQLEWLWSFGVALEPLSAILGALVFEPMADTLGRPRTLIVSGIPFGLSFLLQSAMFYFRSMIPLILGRFIAGLTYTVFYNTITIYIVEIAPVSQRGRWSLAYFIFLVIGLAFELILGLPEVLARPSTWHYLLMLICILLVPCLVILPFLPDTPSYLFLVKGKPEEAIRSLEFYSLIDSGLEILVKPLQTSIQPNRNKLKLIDFLRLSQLNAHKLIIVAYSGCVAFGGFVFIDYLTQFLILSGLTDQLAAGIAAGSTCLAAVSAVLSSLTIDKLGRRKVLILVIGIISCTLTAMIILRLLQQGSETSILFQAIMSISLAACFSALFGALNSMSFIIGEILPVKARASGFVVYMLSLNIFTVITAQLFNVMEEMKPGSGLLLHLIPFLLFSVLLLVALPETKGMTPEAACLEVWNRARRIMGKANQSGLENINKPLLADNADMNGQIVDYGTCNNNNV